MASYEKVHPTGAFCYKRRNGRITLFVFMGPDRWEFNHGA